MHRKVSMALVWAIATSAAIRCLAVPVVFTIDTQQTVLTLSGQIDNSNILIVSPGSLTSSYGGPGGNNRLFVDLQPASIQFTFGNGIVARDLRQFNVGIVNPFLQFAHVAGGFTGVNAGVTKFYDFELALNFSASGHIPIAGGTFAANQVSFAPSGLFNFVSANPSYNGLGESFSFFSYNTNQSANPATLTSHHGRITLNLPINYTRSFTGVASGFPYQLNWLGQLVAFYDEPITQSNIVDLFPGSNVTRGVNGGAAEIGGLQVTFPQIITGGEFSVDYAPTLIQDLSPELIDSIDFLLASDPLQMWSIEFTGSFATPVELVFGYSDGDLLVPESNLTIYHQQQDGGWMALPTIGRDFDANTITVLTDSFSPFVLGATVPEPAGGLLSMLAGVMIFGCRRVRYPRFIRT